MNKKILWITETAVMLALLVALQALTKPLSQYVTGSVVNCLLAVTVLVAGPCSGLCVAIVSPVLAYLLGIAPNILVVPAIMVGNAVFVAVWYLLSGRNRHIARQLAAWISAAAAKFLVMYAVVVWLFCDILAKQLLASGMLKPPMLKMLPGMFSWPQLVTALIGGAVALSITPVLRKALHK